MCKKKINKDKEQIRNYYFNAFKIWKLKARIEEEDWIGVPRDARELFVVKVIFSVSSGEVLSFQVLGVEWM